MISVTTSGSLAKTNKILADLGRSTSTIESRIRSVCEAGVHALQAATPKDSGETAMAWSYEIVKSGNGFTINWKNSHVNEGVNIAILLQYGHGTGTGGYVPGRDYINPALKPIFDQILNEARKAVTSA